MFNRPLNKSELMQALKKEGEFRVLHIATGDPKRLSDEIKRMQLREVTVIVLSKR